MSGDSSSERPNSPPPGEGRCAGSSPCSGRGCGGCASSSCVTICGRNDEEDMAQETMMLFARHTNERCQQHRHLEPQKECARKMLRAERCDRCVVFTLPSLTWRSLSFMSEPPSEQINTSTSASLATRATNLEEGDDHQSCRAPSSFAPGVPGPLWRELGGVRLLLLRSLPVCLPLRLTL